MGSRPAIILVTAIATTMAAAMPIIRNNSLAGLALIPILITMHASSYRTMSKMLASIDRT